VNHVDNLGRCVEYQVDSPNGRVGSVAEVRYAPDDATVPEALAVRAGRRSNWLLIIPLSQIAEITVPNHRVVLYDSPRITATERVPIGR
jgi:hypothetical protein